MQNREHAYALETTGLFISALGMLLLILVSAWITSMFIVGSRQLTDDVVGTVPSLSFDRQEVAALGSQIGDQGRVAGVVDDSTENEESLRNDVAEWLSVARQAGDNTVAYRDGTLDRNAQNHARQLATECRSDIYNIWEESLGLKLDQGYVSSFAESAFEVSGVAFASELPLKEIDYQRLFTNINAYGVGVAKTSEGCSFAYSLTVHLAETN